MNNIIMCKQKAFLTILSMLIIGLSVLAQQQTLLVHGSGTVIFQKDVSEIDSVIFSKTFPIGLTNSTQSETMSIYRLGAVIFEKAVTEIDSFYFHETTLSAPITVTGMLTGTTVHGCDLAAAPSPATSVSQLESMDGGITINDACTEKDILTVSSVDVVSGSCPITITRTYTVKDACNNNATIVHVINVQDSAPPVVSGKLTDTTVMGCPDASAPIAVTTVADLELLTGSITINDACTAKADLIVSSVDVIKGTCPTNITRNYTVRDACNNDVKIVHVITIRSISPPINLVNIPAGTFTMGSPTNEVDREAHENQHEVTLSAFKMSAYEITNAQYSDFLNNKSIGGDGLYADGTYPTQPLIKASSGSYDFGLHYIAGQWLPVAGFENHPVINVTWYGATAIRR